MFEFKKWYFKRCIVYYFETSAGHTEQRISIVESVKPLRSRLAFLLVQVASCPVFNEDTASAANKIAACLRLEVTIGQKATAAAQTLSHNGNSSLVVIIASRIYKSAHLSHHWHFNYFYSITTEQK